MSSSDMRPSEKLTPGVRTSDESISTPWAWPPIPAKARAATSATGVPANAASVHQRNAAPDATLFSLTARERQTASSFGCPATGSAMSVAAPW